MLEQQWKEEVTERKVPSNWASQECYIEHRRDGPTAVFKSVTITVTSQLL